MTQYCRRCGCIAYYTGHIAVYENAGGKRQVFHRSPEVYGFHKWGYPKAVYGPLRNRDGPGDSGGCYSGKYIGRGGRRGIDLFFRCCHLQLCRKPLVCLSVFSADDWNVRHGGYGARHMGDWPAENFEIY